MDLDERLRAIELEHAVTKTELKAIVENVGAIRDRMDEIADTMRRFGEANAKFSVVLVVCAAVAGAALPVIFRRVFE